MATDYVNFLDSFKRIKMIEISLPIAMYPGYVTPLLVGDDLAIRTSVSSPVGYDREMNKLLYQHTELYNPEDSIQKINWNFEQFVNFLSNIDRTFMLWGIYKATYETLGKRKIKCDNPDCDDEHEEDVSLDDLIHEDTIVPWEEEKPFYEYIYPIEIPYEHMVFTFNTWIPNIKRNNNLLSLIPIDVMQKNLEQINSAFTQPENMTLLTKSIKITDKSNERTVETEVMQEILATFKSIIPKSVGETFFEEYGKKFDKYSPKFYKIVKCPTCSKEIKYYVDIEVEFFRRSLLGRGEGS